MVHADAALFIGLGHYWTGMARILRAELEDSEIDGFKEAADIIGQALEQVNIAREHEERILGVAQSVEYSAYFVRRHEVASYYTEALSQGLEEMTRDLADGYYPAAACGMLNRVLARVMANYEQDARIEGVLGRLEAFGAGLPDPPDTAIP